VCQGHHGRHWGFVPLIGVGPLRFGMSSDEVVAALARPGEVSGGSGRHGTTEIEYKELTTYYTDGLLL